MKGDATMSAVYLIGLGYVLCLATVVFVNVVGRALSEATNDLAPLSPDEALERAALVHESTDLIDLDHYRSRATRAPVNGRGA
jgi:hypothetical protein